MNNKSRLWEGFLFWPGFTDVIVVTLLVFLFFLVVQMGVSLELVQSDQITECQARVAQQVGDALGQDQKALTIDANGNLQRLQFSDRILFNRGEADLLPTGAEVMRAVGDILLKNASLYKNMQVEGHTDARPINTSRFPSNWELSSARATSVVRFLQDQVGFDPKILSSTGYAEYQPIAAEPTDEGFARNRRVEVVLVYSTTTCTQDALVALPGGPAQESPPDAGVGR